MTAAGEDWVCRKVRPSGPIEVTHERPWATVARVPVGDGQVWFKRCAPVQAFEPRLTAALFGRWPALAPQVIAHDDRRGWLLLADAGTAAGELGNPPQLWLDALPAYAELQRGEAAFAAEHVDAGVPDLRVEILPGRYSELLTSAVPLTDEERSLLARFESTFHRWCRDLAGSVPSSVQHDDLHHGNLFLRPDGPRIIDWGDTCVSHPFASLVVTFQFLEQINGLGRGDPWFIRLRDAYLEPWGSGLSDVFELAVRVGVFAHAIAWIRQRQALPRPWLPRFDAGYRAVLERALTDASQGLHGVG